METGRRLTLANDDGEPWAAIRNPELDLGVALRWNVDVMPYAWLWQELNATAYPWFGRAYVTAIKPSTTTAGGPERESLTLGGGATFEAGIRLAVCGGTRPIRSVDADGNVQT